MQSRGGASGMSGGHVNYGATEQRNNPPPQRTNPFDDDDDTRPVPIGTDIKFKFLLLIFFEF